LDDQTLYHIEVELGDLSEVGKEFARLLRERLKTEAIIRGSRVTLREDSSGHPHPKEVKMLVKHVLHHLGFSQGYRVLSGRNVIRIVKVEKKQRHAEKEGVAASPSQTLPYLFPT
jgi:hypothetical protein